ncbi:hypothetical protein Lal_00033272 [Lupinus albus]|uniref:Probable purine permease n=1 Tax=Lupinus albus TaxID=3870 RepID=A0A6A4QF99_LUPAL|nr:putative purine permease, plant [Lupinus albus]KAF1879614.1 hypothetical protein Lal_00033272 [Lupinus albus]
MTEVEKDRTKKRILLILSCLMLALGTSGGPLILRLYFIHGGKRIWLSSFLQTSGFPISLLPFSIFYIIRRHRLPVTGNNNNSTATQTMFTMKPLYLIAFAAIGLLYGVDNILYCYGLNRLPVSTASLVTATQLGFTAIMAFFIVRQKFSAYSVNAVVLLTIGAGVLALHGGGDRVEGESSKQYVMGFVMSLMAAALFGFVLPLLELVYSKMKQTITYSVMIESQLIVGLFATLFSVLGMIINNDFKEIPKEAKQFGLGEANYYLILVASSIIWHLNFLGASGITFCASSLLSGVMVSLMMVVTEVLGVLVFKEKFKAEKGVSLALSLWGFLSYFYGELKKAKKLKNNHIPKEELPQNHNGFPHP